MRDAPDKLKPDFPVSWDRVEELFEDMASHKNWSFFKVILPLIKDLRKRGYDQTLRAGQSIFVLVLSRASTHGLTKEHSTVQILVQPPNKMVVYMSNDGKLATLHREDMTVYEFNRIGVNTTLIQLLDDLAKRPLDG